jgi:hypothetical protein
VPAFKAKNGKSFVYLFKLSFDDFDYDEIKDVHEMDNPLYLPR